MAVKYYFSLECLVMVVYVYLSSHPALLERCHRSRDEGRKEDIDRCAREFAPWHRQTP